MKICSLVKTHLPVDQDIRFRLRSGRKCKIRKGGGELPILITMSFLLRAVIFCPELRRAG